MTDSIMAHIADGLHLSEKGQQNFGRIMSTAILDVMGY